MGFATKAIIFQSIFCAWYSLNYFIINGSLNSFLKHGRTENESVESPGGFYSHCMIHLPMQIIDGLGQLGVADAVHRTDRRTGYLSPHFPHRGTAMDTPLLCRGLRGILGSDSTVTVVNVHDYGTISRGDTIQVTSEGVGRTVTLKDETKRILLL